jgi:hypothetical protein
MKKKIIIMKRLVIFAIVIGLCTTAVQISAISTTHSSTNHKISTKNINEKHLLSKTFNKEKISSIEIKPTESYSNKPIITTEYACHNPGITTDGRNILVIAEDSQSVMASDLVMTYSSDGGITWSDLGSFPTEDVIETKPVIDYCYTNDFQAYGTCLPDSTGTLCLIHFPSMTDPDLPWGEDDGWTIWSTTIDFDEYYAIDIAGYPYGENAPAPEFHGVLTLIGADSGGETIDNYYETEGGSISACYLNFVGQLGDTISVDIDVSTETYFEAMELQDDSDIGIDDGVFLEYCWVEPGNDAWWENDWPTFTFEGAHNPALVADSGNCYCVCELNGSIVCYYSNDNGETFQSSLVATNGQFPAVSASDKTVICSYIRDGDLYAAKSVDGGVTWHEFSAMNDVSGSVVEEESSIDIASVFVAWTDNRNTNNGIYFAPVGTAPLKPQDLTGPQSGDINTDYTYTTSSSDPDGDQIYYVFYWGDNTTSEVGPYTSGETGSATHKWTEKGDYIIKVKARDSSGLESEWSDSLPITMPCSYNKPLQQFLEKLFERFPNAFPILRQLLGY